jgi:hypothetical protein
MLNLPALNSNLKKHYPLFASILADCKLFVTYDTIELVQNYVYKPTG